MLKCAGVESRSGFWHTNITYFVFSCSLAFLELMNDDAEEAREELKLFLFPSSAFT